MAWLHAAPKRNKKDENPKSRLELLSEDDPARELPDINLYLSMCFELLGICSNTGMGLTALTWFDVKSFCDQSSYPLTGWESEQIVLMSRAYCRMSHKATKVGFPSPYNLALEDEDALEVNRSIVNDRFLSMVNETSK